MDTIIGIDLGTTNSEVAVIQEGKPVVIADENNRVIMPSVVSLSEDEQILVGEPAGNQYILYPERTIKSIKRKMGSDEKITLGDNSYTPQEISAMIRTFCSGPLNVCGLHLPEYFLCRATMTCGCVMERRETHWLNSMT